MSTTPTPCTPCTIHGASAETHCLTCDARICAACVAVVEERCPPCAHQHRRKARIVRSAAAGVGTLVVGSFVALLIVSGGISRATPKAVAPPPKPAGPPPFDYGTHHYTVENTQARLDKDPCNKSHALKLGETLNQAGDHARALALVTGWEPRCGAWPRLLWVAQHAHEQRREWEKAAGIATRLIASRPDDSDYWWWRGRDHVELGLDEQALIDLWQSLANQPNGFAANLLDKMARKNPEHACGAAFALQRFIEARPERAGRWATARRSELYVAGDCARLAGRGRTDIRHAASAPSIITTARLNGKPFTLVVMESAGHTVLTRSIGEAIGAEPTGRKIQVQVLGETLEAQLAMVKSFSVGGASAAEVQVALVDRLPGQITGLVGQTFLHRFQVSHVAAGLRLVAY
jgi:hypothetical protein